MIKFFQSQHSYFLILNANILFHFQDILIESELVAPGSVNGVLSGKHYNRSVRSHKVIFEALSRLLFQSYFDSISAPERDAAIALIGKHIRYQS